MWPPVRAHVAMRKSRISLARSSSWASERWWAMVTCGFLSAWQWGRAGTAMGSAVNVGYGLQWPVFAVFFAWIWWRMLRI